MHLNIATECPALSDIESKKFKRALSSVRSFNILGDYSAKHGPFQIKEWLQRLPRSAVLRISTYNLDPQILSLVDHPLHLIQLEYRQYSHRSLVVSPTVPAWCRSSGRFDSVSLYGCAVGEIASFCKKLTLHGLFTSQDFLSSSSGLDIEELHCDSEVDERSTLYRPKVLGMDKLSKLTSTFSFALALLQQRRLPMLQELVFLARSRAYIHSPPERPREYLLGPITDLLMESTDARAPIRLLSIPIWASWESLFKVAKILSQGNDSGPNPMLLLPSFPHPHLLLPLVKSLKGEPVTQTPDIPAYLSEEYCKSEGVCFECHNGGWMCADAAHCRRGRRGELVAITRYTLSS
jgi:hypothetical protein